MSVFLEVVESEWVCSNDLAFAFRDRYPVQRGLSALPPDVLRRR